VSIVPIIQETEAGRTLMPTSLGNIKEIPSQKIKTPKTNKNTPSCIRPWVY
jgi:hypothetical protein